MNFKEILELIDKVADRGIAVVDLPEPVLAETCDAVAAVAAIRGVPKERRKAAISRAVELCSLTIQRDDRLVVDLDLVALAEETAG